ncbi:hypothetical protein B0T14DRAFT_557465 [Immersiella caudata]|uniref:Uncharacterized protein n=1 Tax=Immersiella caudata TaxID=314043 RepID=A0AA39WEV9_9PEZI|nr:hypothetical protein B0T14DRAFT_557465 [Immersiella caudata]
MGVSGAQQEIHFANVFDQPMTWDGLSRLDYIWLRRLHEGESTLTYYTIEVWENQGTGGAKLKGDGVRHANMMGNANGAADLLWVSSIEEVRIYESRGGGFEMPPYFGANYLIFNEAGKGRRMDRRDLRFADWNGSGLDDIIHIDPDSGVMDVWINKRKTTRNFNTWVYRYNVGPSRTAQPNCPKRYQGYHGPGVRFANIDGNGMADVHCLDADGKVWGYLNTIQGTLTRHFQFKASDGYGRANLRFADVTGDGLADMPFSKNSAATSFAWTQAGKKFEGTGQGNCVYFANLDGNGRVKVMHIDSLTNSALTLFNDCANGGGGYGNTHTELAVLPAPDIKREGPDEFSEYHMGTFVGEASVQFCKNYFRHIDLDDVAKLTQQPACPVGAVPVPTSTRLALSHAESRLKPWKRYATAQAYITTIPDIIAPIAVKEETPNRQNKLVQALERAMDELERLKKENAELRAMVTELKNKAAEAETRRRATTRWKPGSISKKRALPAPSLGPFYLPPARTQSHSSHSRSSGEAPKPTQNKLNTRTVPVPVLRDSDQTAQTTPVSAALSVTFAQKTPRTRQD